MNEQELKQRTYTFALRIIDLADSLPQSRTGNVIANQVIRSGTSVAQTTGHSAVRNLALTLSTRPALLRKKLMRALSGYNCSSIVVCLPHAGSKPLLTEANELTAIFVTSRKTASGRQRPFENRKPRIENP